MLSVPLALVVKSKEWKTMPQQDSMFQSHETAYFADEKVMVRVLSRGAYCSTIVFDKWGISSMEVVDNDDLIFRDEDTDDL
jgi:hypothetical protein